MSRHYFERISPCSHCYNSSVTVNGKQIPYQLIAEDTIIQDKEGRDACSFFSWTYLRTDTPASQERPVLFAFNGGPTTSSTWLHWGFYGPRILQLQEDGMPPAEPPYLLRDNPDCLLDLCDLVLIDPVNTGFSRLLIPDTTLDYLGDHADAHAVSLFIRSWLKQHGRMHAPKFLSGESFGSTRASLLAWELRDCQPISGVVHIGPGYSSDHEPLRTFKDLPPAAATHWYYSDDPNKPPLREYLDQCRTFLYQEYVPAIYQGSQLPQNQRIQIAQRLSALTGLSAAYYLEHNLLLSRADFRSLRLADRGLKLGNYDSRFTLPSDDPREPFDAAFTPPLRGCRAAFFREIGLSLSRTYREYSFEDDPNWDWYYSASPGIVGMGDHGISMAGANAAAVQANPDLMFFFATGCYDTVATIENTRYAVTHTDIPLEHVTMLEYESGHAVYADDCARHQLAQDLRTFLSAIL